MNIAMISDWFSTKEYPGGGAELVDATICTELNITTKILSSATELPDEHIFIITNFFNISKELYSLLCSNKYSFIIIEHDYKFFPTRNPWNYPNSICDTKRFIELYSAAKKTYLQSEDQLGVFKLNNIPGNFYNFDCSIWSEYELDILEKLCYSSKNTPKSSLFFTVNLKNPGKGTGTAIEWCKTMRIKYCLSTETTWHMLMNEMAGFTTLVFTPGARESLCRLVVEAKCIGLNVITTTMPYGATASPFYEMDSNAIIYYLREKSKRNLEELKNTCNELANKSLI